MTIFLLIFIFLNILSLVSPEGRCYSCSGTCHNENCNCQMGSCASDQCFIERKPTEEKGVLKITKGCLRRSPRTLPGCERDNFDDHILCVCKGRFCNENIHITRNYARNITCRKCGERDPDCSDTCVGQWCHEDTTTGASGCGYGPPSLPFFQRGVEILPYSSRLCVTISRGAGKPRRHCICATNLCNIYSHSQAKSFYGNSISRYGVLRSRSSGADPTLNFHTCVNCEVNSHDTSVTSSCKQNKCVGHFCTYVSQRHYSVAPNKGTSFHSMTEKQGCINVSDSTNVHLGCTRKWMQNEYEEIVCACQGNMCNRDEYTASSTIFSVCMPLLLSVLASLF